MAVFGVPVAHEDDAERAVRAALAVRDRVRELNEGRSGLSIPEVHSGVNSGEVMVGPASEASGIAARRRRRQHGIPPCRSRLRPAPSWSRSTRGAGRGTRSATDDDARTWRKGSRNRWPRTRPERPGRRSRRGEPRRSSEPSSWTARSSSSGCRPSSVPCSRTVGRESSSSAGRPARARPGWLRSSPSATPTRWSLPDDRPPTGNKWRCRPSRPPSERSPASRRDPRPRPAAGGSRRSPNAWQRVTTRATWREGCRCSSGSAIAQRATGRGAPRTPSTPLGRSWKDSRASGRSSSCSTTFIGRIRPSWTRSARSGPTRGPDRS